MLKVLPDFPCQIPSQSSNAPRAVGPLSPHRGSASRSSCGAAGGPRDAQVRRRPTAFSPLGAPLAAAGGPADCIPPSPPRPAAASRRCPNRCPARRRSGGGLGTSWSHSSCMIYELPLPTSGEREKKKRKVSQIPLLRQLTHSSAIAWLLSLARSLGSCCAIAAPRLRLALPPSLLRGRPSFFEGAQEKVAAAAAASLLLSPYPPPRRLSQPASRPTHHTKQPFQHQPPPPLSA